MLLSSEPQDASVWVGNGWHLHTNDAGRASVTLAFGKTGRRPVIVTDPEYHKGRTAVRVS